MKKRKKEITIPFSATSLSLSKPKKGKKNSRTIPILPPICVFSKENKKKRTVFSENKEKRQKIKRKFFLREERKKKEKKQKRRGESERLMGWGEKNNMGCENA